MIFIKNLNFWVYKIQFRFIIFDLKYTVLQTILRQYNSWDKDLTDVYIQLDVKKIKIYIEKYVENQINECKLLAQIHSDFVIKYYDSFIEENKLNICMEYASQGTLRDLILKVKNINENQAYQIITQLAIGLGELHANNIIHRDYKSMNIFINQNLFKIGDLGVSKQIDQENFLCQTITGSPYYLSPELCKGEPYTQAVDIYALGVTMYELLNQGHHPFEAPNQAALLVNILKGKYQQLSFRYSKKLKNIVYACLEQNPQQRPTIYDILKDQIIQQIIKQNKFVLSDTLKQKLQKHNSSYYFDKKQEINNINNTKQQQNTKYQQEYDEMKINSVESETIELESKQNQSESDDFDDEDDQQLSQTVQNQEQINKMNQYLQEDRQLFQKFQQLLTKIKSFKLQQKIQDQILQYYRMNQKPVFQDIEWLLDGVQKSEQKQLEVILNQYGQVQRQRQYVQKQLNNLLK